jgi:hypothetical protein
MIIKDDDERMALILKYIEKGKVIPFNIHEKPLMKDQRMDKVKVKRILDHISTLNRKPHYISLACKLFLEGFDYTDIANILNCLNFRTNRGNKFNHKTIARSVFFRYYMDVLEKK